MILNSLFLRPFFTQVSLCAVVILGLAPAALAEVEIESFGHSSFLIKGGGHSVLLNPFKAVGCAAGLKEPNVNADIFLASSEA